MKKIGFIFGVLSLQIILLVSCKIGLGQSVDTKAPELSVLTPNADSIIRDAFRLSGEWSDDGEIKELTVNLSNTSGLVESLDYTGFINKDDGTWNCVINPLDAEKPVPDGTYEAIITITDTYEHSTVCTRMFKIDNTAPIIVLQRPSSKADDKLSNFDSYGQTFSLEGQTSDDNNVDLIEVKIYADKECTNLLHTIKKTNVPPNMSEDIAAFAEGIENDYSKIYGSTTKNGTKEFYCTIAAYDGSQKYPSDGSAQSDEDKLGNVTTSYYLYDDISSGILSKYKITEVYHMLNGSFVNNEDVSRTANDISDVKELLSKSVISKGGFSLNPANNPMFSVSGKDPLKKDGTDFTANQDMYVSNGSLVVLEVSPGLDGITLNSDSLKVYVIECDNNGAIISGAPRLYPTTTKTKSGSGYKFVANINNATCSISIGNNYLFGVEGNDISGNAILPSGSGYGFHFASSGAAPVLNITSPANTISYLKKGDKLEISGTTTVEEGIPVVTITYGDKDIYTSSFTEADVNVLPNEKREFTFKYEVPAGTGGFDQSTSSQYNYTIKSSREGVESSLSKTIMYDVDGPQVSIISVSPLASLYTDEDGTTDGNTYLNGKISFKVSITDDYDVLDQTINPPKYEFIQNGVTKISGQITSPTMQTISNVDIGGKCTDEEVDLQITAYDRAGNKTVYSTKDDVNSPNYIVKAETDLPYVLPNNSSSFSIKAFTSNKYKAAFADENNVKNLFTTNGAQLMLKLIDDDGINNVKCWCAKEGENYSTDEKPNEYVNRDIPGNPTEYLYSFDLPTIPDTYKVKLEVTDVNGNKKDTGDFYIEVTAAAPVVSVKIDGISFITTNTTDVLNPISKIKTEVSIQSKVKPFTLSRKEYDSNGNEISGATDHKFVNASGVEFDKEDSENPKIDDYFVPEKATTSGSYTLKYTVKDSKTHEGYATIDFTVDNDKPTVTITKTPNTSDTERASFKFEGTAKDVNGSGVTKVQYAFSATPEVNKIYDALGDENWTATVVFGDYDYFDTEGPKNIWVRAIDKVGNLGPWTKSNDFTYDKGNPEISVTKMNDVDISNNRSFQTGQAFSLSGIAKDGYSLADTDAIEVTQGGTEKATIKIQKSSIAETDGSWKLENLPRSSSNPDQLAQTNGKVKSGTYTYLFTIKDKEGKTESTETYTVIIDNEAPTLTLKNPSVTTSISGESSLSGNSFTFKAQADDNTGGTGVSKLYYLFSTVNKDKDAYSDSDFTDIDASDGISVSIPKDLIAGTTSKNGELYEGQWYFVLYAIDAAGNKTERIKKDFYVDMSAPEVTETYVTESNGKKVTKDTVIKLQGDFIESNGIKSFVVSEGATKLKEYSVSEITSLLAAKKWELEFSSTKGNQLSDGTHEIKIEAIDNANRKTTINRTIVVDTKNPTVETITVPASGSKDTESSLYKFTGTVSDNSPSSGYDVVEFTFSDSSTQPADGAKTFTTTAGTDGKWSYPVEFASEDFKSFFTNQGDKYLWVRVKDNAGNVSSWKSGSFVYDTESPSITETGINSDGTYKNDKFTLSGTAKDSYKIKSVTVTAKNENTEGKKEYLSTDLGSVTLTGSNTEKTWSLEIPKSTVVDGVYTFTIEVEDEAGKKYPITRKLTVDTIAPKLTFETLPTGSITDSSGKVWYKSPSLKIEGTYAETLSGIQKVECTINDGSSIDLLSANDKWNGTINLISEGSNKIEVKATDIAGNASTVDCTKTVYLDTKEPDTCTVSSVDSETTVTSEYTKLTNGNATISVVLSVEDYDTDGEGTYSGIDTTTKENTAVRITKIGSKTVDIKSTYDLTNKNFTLTIPKYGKGTGEIEYTSGIVKATVTDIAGNSKEVDLFQLQLDDTYPKAEIKDIPAAINGTITISGTARDDQTLSSIKAQYKLNNASDTAWADIPSTTGTLEGTDNWILTLYTTKLTDTTKYDLRIVATDAAGNIGNSGTKTSDFDSNLVKTIYVDQDSDRPEIRFITPSSISGMTTSNPIWLKNTGTIIGMISDDDSSSSGIVEDIKYTKKYILETLPTDWSTAEYFKDAKCSTKVTGTFVKGTYYKWETYSLGSNSSFSIDVDDGDQEIYFYVEDNKSGKFISGKTTEITKEPKFTDGTNKITENVILSMKIDKTSPRIDSNNIEYAVFDSINSEYSNFSKNVGAHSYGGTNNKIKIIVPASDANGIKSVTAKVTNGSSSVPIKGTCNDTSYKDEKNHNWTIGDIPLAGTVGQAIIEVTVEDNAGLTSQEKISLTVDNTSPTVLVSSPSVNTVSSGEVTVYGTLTEVCSDIRYAITTDPSEIAPKLDGTTKVSTWNGFTVGADSSLTPLDNQTKTETAITYTPLNGATLSWYLYFNGRSPTDTQTNDVQLKYFLDEDHLKVTTRAKIDSNDQSTQFQKVVQLYLWIYAKDDAGNESYTRHELRVDPQGGRPVVTIDYPEANSSLGGTIRLSGSAEDSNGTVQSVWVQIISKTHGSDTTTVYGTATNSGESGAYNVTSFNLNGNDLNYMKENTATTTNKVLKIEKEVENQTEWNGTGTANSYAIKANLSGTSWNLKINNNNEYKPSSNVNDMYIRVYALDNDGQQSYAATKYFKVDASKPVISNVMLKQYTNGKTSTNVLNGETALAEQEYEAGKFLKGDWFLTFEATDDDAIGSVAFVDEDFKETPLEQSYYKKSTDGKTVNIAYPLDGTKTNFSIKVSDNSQSPNTSTQNIEVFFDNLPPKLRRPGSSSAYSIPATIKQSNGFYTFKSQIDESSSTTTQSGLKSVAFYFLRRNSVNNKVYVMDPMQVRTGEVQVKDAKKLGATGEGSVVYDSGLYWLKRTIVRDSNYYNKFTYTADTTNATDEQSIHTGGLVQIGGVIYTITDKTGTIITVDKNIPDKTTAYIALGLVVDTAVEKYEGSIGDNGYYTTWVAGDGDNMYESLGGTTANRTWEAQISAKNIPDGSVELHYVAFDNAGNYSIGIVGNADWTTYSNATGLYATEDVKDVKSLTPGSVGDFVDFAYAYTSTEPCYISNNPPRLASVTVGCDYDGNGTIGNQTNEKKTYFCKKVSGKDVAGGVTDNLVVDSGDAAFMKLTDASSIEMEIIGGNGSLYYSYNIDGASSNKISGANATSFATGNNDGEESDYLKNGEVTYKDETAKKAHIKKIDLPLTQFDNYLGKGSGSGKTNTAYIANNTTEKPLTTFEYTIWDSTDGEKVAGNNALSTWSTQKSKMTVKLDVQVHDETAPKMVIDDFTTSHFEAATGHIDLSSNLPNTPFNGSNGQFDKDPKVSGKIKVTGYAYDNIRLESLWLKVDGFTFTPTTALTGGTNRDVSDGYVQVAKFANGSWTGTENTTAGWTFSVSKDESDGAYQNDAGHKVMWTLELDTTKVSGVAAADRTISVYAKDVRGTSAITTKGLYSNNSNNTTAGDTTFNKPNYRVDVVPYITSLARGTGLETKRSKLGKYQVVIGESVAVTGFNLPTGDAYYRVKTANMKSTTVPNTNKITSASRTVTGATLTVPGNSGYVVAVTNNIVSLNNMNTGNVQTGVNSDDVWTDDVYLNAWKNDEYFYFSNDPISPAMDRIPYTTNNSTVNRLYGGWATNGSNFYASYPNTTGSGSKGNAPSPASGNSATSTSSSNFGDPATFYDVVTDANGNRYNVLLDCWQGSTNGWGKNFVINYNGYYYHNSCTTNNPNSDSIVNNENLRHVIERMGNGGTAPDNANSSDGLDEMFNQFLNPRITMYNGEAYITYYDRYAKCLKWAMSAPINDRNNLPKKYATEGIWLENKYQKNAKDSNGKSAYYKNGGFVVAGYDTLQNSGSKTNLDVGLWSAIAIDTAASDTTAAPVIAYYDGTNKKLMLATASGSGSGPSVAYPINSNSPVLTGTNVSGTEGNAWKRTEVTGSAALKLGQYVSMVVDSSNNLHIAAYGTAGGNKLYYVKGTKSAYGTYTFETTCVDSNGAGTWTDIQLDSDGNPVISYYDPSNDSSEHAVKVAYFDGTNWDTMTAPLASSAVSNRITLALDVTDGATISAAGTTRLTANNSKLAVGYVSSRFDCVYLRKE